MVQSNFKGNIKYSPDYNHFPNYKSYINIFDRSDYDLDSSGSYPPENMIQESNNRLIVELALAGFNRSELKVYTENGKLYIEGSKESKLDRVYIKRRIAQRNFKWVKIIPDYMRVDAISYVDGLLSITFIREIPDHEKRKDYSF